MPRFLTLLLSICIGMASLTVRVGYANTLFSAVVKDDSINIRTDATTTAEVICTINKDKVVEVVAESYDWLKIKLPADAPVFVHKKMVTVDTDQKTRISKDKVNLRLHPNLNAPILGKAREGTVIKIVKEENDWYAIEPTETSFGWIHKNFLKRIETQPAKPAEQNNENASKNMVTVEGLLKTKTMTKIATHKLICPRNEIYLIKGEKDQLNPFNNRMVTIVGKLSSPVNDTLPIIEVDEIRASE